MEKGTILLNDYSNCLIKIADRKQNVIDTASNISKISRVVFRDEFAIQVSKAFLYMLNIKKNYLV